MREAFAGEKCKCGEPAGRYVGYRYLCYACYDKMKKDSRCSAVGPVELRVVKDPKMVHVKRPR